MKTAYQPDALIADVEGVRITEGDVDTLQQLLGEQGASFEGEVGRNQLRDELVHQQLLYFDGRDRRLDEEPEFQQALAATRRHMLQQYTLKKLLEDVAVNEEEVQAYYREHADRFGADASWESVRDRVESEYLLLRQQEHYLAHMQALMEKYSVKKYYGTGEAPSADRKEAL